MARCWPGISSGRTSVSKATYFAPGWGGEFGQQIGQLDAAPGNDHRPGLDAAEAVDALFYGKAGKEVGEVVRTGLVGEAVDGDGPGRGFQRAGIGGGVSLVGAEFVVIVVAGDFLECVGLLVGGVAARGKSGGGQQGGGTGDDLAAVQVAGFGGHVGPVEVGFEGHRGAPVRLDAGWRILRGNENQFGSRFGQGNVTGDMAARRF